MAQHTYDLGGNHLIVDGISVGATGPGQAGTSLASTELSKLDGLTGSLVQMQEVTFTETDGAGEYTGSITVPAGCYLIDVIVHGVAVWDNDGAVDMDVGFAGGTEIFDITSLKAAGDLVAGESISFGTGSDGGEGGSTASTNYARYSATARTITGAITTASTGGSTGRTRMIVVYALPQSTSAAVKV